LGNTAAVCRRSYIHPAVIEAHKEGTLAAIMRRPRSVVPGLRPVEVAVLRLLATRKRAVAIVKAA
jgi:DNA topoisomerase IB